MKHTALIALLLACGPSTRELRSMLSETCTCPCPPADAGVDAPADAAPDAPPDAPPVPPPIDLTQPWTRTTITAGGTAPLLGADGVAEDAEHCWWTPWEQGQAVTRACPIGASWSSEIVANESALAGVEDVKPADFDGDGLIDGAIAVSGTSNAAVRIVFRGTVGTILLPASQLLGAVMQVAAADMDGDNDVDIVFGTQKLGTTPGTISWLENPGPGLVRIGLHWNRHDISPAGWPMSIVPFVENNGAAAVVVSDRVGYPGTSCFTGEAPAAGTCWDLFGARWMRPLSGGGWIRQRIGNPTGSCSPYTSPTCAKTPGDEMMLDVVSVDGAGNIDLVVDGQSKGSVVDSRVMIHSLAASTHTVIPPVANVGHYQHAIAYDVDEDGDLDLVVSTWIADSLATADRTKSGVYWLRNNGDGTWSRGEVSGLGQGQKFDNLAKLGRCVVTSEQVDELGVVAYCPPGVSLP